MKRISNLGSILLLAALVSLFGCGKNQTTPHYATIMNQDPTSELNDQLFASANLALDRSDYLLGPGDLLEIKVLEDEKLNSSSRISSRGYVSIPLLNEVRLEGLTASEAEQFIETRFQEKYIKDPHVSVFIKEHFSQRVTVVGQVKNPGTFDYPSRQRLLDTIALAGGLTENASQVIQVHRKGGSPEEKDNTVLIDLEELIKKGRTNLNIDINGGDVVYIPEAGSFFVDGAVRRPGEYHIRQVISIEEAIITAGGYQSFAKTDRVMVMRSNEDGKREEINIEIDKNLQAVNRFFVQDRDIIIINSSFWGKVFNGSGLNLGIPGMGVSYRPVD